MYLDSAYVAKFYLNEPDSWRVRAVIESADILVTSALAVAEVSCTFHRKLRERMIAESHYHELLAAFGEHAEAGIWSLAPITDRLLSRIATAMAALPSTVYLRSGDAVHLVTAMDLAETEIWSNDKNLLAAAPYFGLTGRSA
jgi:predicted nucleic acid-binding protein